MIAADLELTLLRVNLTAVVSKYIGETEKNLKAAMNSAARLNAVLLPGETDALFGGRNEVRDAHDRYASIETGFLL